MSILPDIRQSYISIKSLLQEQILGTEFASIDGLNELMRQEDIKKTRIYTKVYLLDRERYEQVINAYVEMPETWQEDLKTYMQCYHLKDFWNSYPYETDGDLTFLPNEDDGKYFLYTDCGNGTERYYNYQEIIEELDVKNPELYEAYLENLESFMIKNNNYCALVTDAESARYNYAAFGEIRKEIREAENSTHTASTSFARSLGITLKDVAKNPDEILLKLRPADSQTKNQSIIPLNIR